MVAPGWRVSTSARQDLQDLVAAHDAALAVDDADPVAVAVEADAELEAALGHACGSDPRDFAASVGIRVMVGEVAVDLGEQQVVAAGQPGGQAAHGRAGRAVAGVPGHREGRAP